MHGRKGSSLANGNKQKRIATLRGGGIASVLLPRPRVVHVTTPAIVCRQQCSVGKVGMAIKTTDALYEALLPVLLSLPALPLLTTPLLLLLLLLLLQLLLLLPPPPKDNKIKNKPKFLL